MSEHKTITCTDCGSSFLFTKGEQDYYAKKNPPLSDPKRCKPCREARKGRIETGAIDPGGEKAVAPSHYTRPRKIS